MHIRTALLAAVLVCTPAYAQLVTITPAQGPRGDVGQAGNTVLSGAGAPSVGLGRDGDYYINTANNTIYGPKNAGAWGSATSLIGPTGNAGAAGSTGASGPSGVNAMGSPTARTIAAGTAYQATDISKPSIVTLSLSSTATLSLSGGTTNAAAVYVGGTGVVATSGGTAVCSYANTNLGALTIGINLSTQAISPCTFALGAGQYFAFRVASGTVTAQAATDSAVG